MHLNRFDLGAVGSISRLKTHLPAWSSLRANERNLLLLVHIQISAGSSSQQLFSSRDTLKKEEYFHL